METKDKPSLSSLIGATSFDAHIFAGNQLLGCGAITRTTPMYYEMFICPIPSPLGENEKRTMRLCDLTNVLNVLCRTQMSTTFALPPVFDQDTITDLLKVTRMIDTMLSSVDPILRRRIEILTSNMSNLQL